MADSSNIPIDEEQPDSNSWRVRSDQTNAMFSASSNYCTLGFDYVPFQVKKEEITDINEKCRETISDFEQKNYNPEFVLQIEMQTEAPVGRMKTHNKQLLKVNSQYLSDETPFSCTTCDRSFDCLEALSQHTTFHYIIGQRACRYRCEYCVQTFTNKGKLKKHYKTHASDPSYECDQCNGTFLTEAYLKDHRNRVHPNERFAAASIPALRTERVYPCPFCDNRYLERASVMYHVRLHTADIVFRCKICDKLFHTKSEMNLHVRSHTGDKLHRCSACNKSFLTTSNLKQHYRVHTGDKPYTCDMCDKAFSSKSNLTQHVKVHTGERPFQCSYCTKSFTTSSNLTQHVRMHTGDKPYACTDCGKTFINNSNLSQHRKGRNCIAVNLE